MRNLEQVASDYYIEYRPQFKFVNEFTIKSENIRWNIDNGIKGVYVIFVNGIPLYVGETITCFKKRFISHKHSIRHPEAKGEITGKRTHLLGLQDEVFSIECIKDSILGIHDRTSSLVSENIFKTAFKPLIM
jgi:hypothetical protein